VPRGGPRWQAAAGSRRGSRAAGGGGGAGRQEGRQGDVQRLPHGLRRRPGRRGSQGLARGQERGQGRPVPCPLDRRRGHRGLAQAHRAVDAGEPLPGHEQRAGSQDEAGAQHVQDAEDLPEGVQLSSPHVGSSRRPGRAGETNRGRLEGHLHSEARPSVPGPGYFPYNRFGSYPAVHQGNERKGPGGCCPTLPDEANAY